jgi:hypothetical protein
MIKVSRFTIAGLAMLALAFALTSFALFASRPTDYGYTPRNNAFMNDVAAIGVDTSDADHVAAVKAVVCSEVNAGWDDARVVSSIADYLSVNNSTAARVRYLVSDYYNC